VTGPEAGDDANSNGRLDQTETWHYTCVHSEGDNGLTTNVATATGNPVDDQGNDLPDIPDVSDTDDAKIFVVNPAIQVVKTAGSAADGEVEYIVDPGGSVTYHYTVTNPGDTALGGVKTGVTDDKCSPLSYAGGDTDGDDLLDTTETWLFTCTTSVTQNTTNTATAIGNPVDDQGNDLPDIPDVSDTDDARVEVVRPEVTVTKTLLSAEPVRPTEEVHFRITIENTGDIWIHDLPLVDEYDKEYLTYGYQSQYATPADSNNHIDDGSIEWADLTGPTPYGFGTDLEPGHSFTVDVYFTAVKDTTQLPGPPAGKTVNTAIVDGALADPDGPGGSAPPPAIPVPRDEDDAAVEIFQPTGLGLVSFDAADQDGGVLLTWETANELDLVGFKLLRRHGKSDYSEITNVIPAEYAGSGSGGVYQYVDTSLTPGYYTYALLAVRYDGSMRLLATDSIMMRWHEPFLDPGDPSLPDVPPTN
jgi:hypothetical protein